MVENTSKNHASKNYAIASNLQQKIWANAHKTRESL